MHGTHTPSTVLTTQPPPPRSPRHDAHLQPPQRGHVKPPRSLPAATAARSDVADPSFDEPPPPHLNAAWSDSRSASGGGCVVDDELEVTAWESGGTPSPPPSATVVVAVDGSST